MLLKARELKIYCGSETSVSYILSLYPVSDCYTDTYRRASEINITFALLRYHLASETERTEDKSAHLNSYSGQEEEEEEKGLLLAVLVVSQADVNCIKHDRSPPLSTFVALQHCNGGVLNACQVD